MIWIYENLICNTNSIILARQNYFLNQYLYKDYDKTITIDFPFCDTSLYELSKKD